MTETKPLPTKLNRIVGFVIFMIGLGMVIIFLRMMLGLASGEIIAKDIPRGVGLYGVMAFLGGCGLFLIVIGNRLVAGKWLS